MDSNTNKSPYKLLNKLEDLYQKSYNFSILNMIKALLLDIKSEKNKK